MLLSFFELSVFIIISFFLIFILLFLSNILAPKNTTNEKTSAYECGFVPFNEARNSFEIHFYVVGILFIIFDIEIVFLVP
jgi:NADH-quinone oxidoreductase subunit A